MKNFNSKLVLIALASSVIATSCKKDNTDEPEQEKPNSTETLANSFFEKVAFKGAFGTTNWAQGWANFNPQNTDYPATNATLEGNITSNTVLEANKVYLLKGFVYVKSGATLTIPAGTIIRGDKDSKATLIVTQGSKLIVNGTANQPVVFTSNIDKGSRSPGDWGGIIILGRAQNNIPGGIGTIEGGINNAANDGAHGGSIANDNSGSLTYLRIEYPGIAFQPNNEINGITFGSVGSATVVDYVQVSYSGDDSFEWFGGTVNAKHLISIDNTDDVFDFDNGYVGKLQFCLGVRNPSIADQAGQSNGIESDNSEKVFDSSPRTRPVISNMTIIGPVANTAALATVNVKHENANLIRRGSQIVLGNSVFIGFKFGIDVRDKETGDALTSKASLIRKNIYQSYVADKDVIASGSTPSFESAAALKTYLTANGNSFNTEAQALMLLANPFVLSNNSYLLKAGSSASTGADFAE